MMKKPLMRIMVIGGLLIVSNSYACPPNQYPTAHLTITPQYVFTGQSVTLDGSGSYDPDGYITLYEWDFDYNGVSFNCDYWESDGNAPDGTFDGVTTHVYDHGGVYIVILRVTDNGGSNDTDTGAVLVTQMYYVDPNGSDDNNGLSWATAFKTIQHGINEAKDYNIVEVNEGTYRENIDFNGITCTVTGIDPNDWEVTANTIIEANDANLDVIILEGVNPVIKGFTITDGNGGIYCDGASSTISNCVIRGNACDGDGGGMWISNSFPLISDCFFVENTAINGGAVYEVNSVTKFINCVFSKNAADANGGAIYNEGSYANLTNCTISRNDANSSEGYGGAIYNHSSSASLANCIVWDNNAYHIAQIFNDNNELDINEPNFVSWWKLDEVDGNEANDSVGSNDGNLINGPVWTNGGLSFDGTDDYVNVPDDDSLRFTQYDSFTLCAWVKPISGGMILCKMQTSGQYNLFTYEIRWNYQRIDFVISRSGHSYKVVSTPNGSAPVNKWFHVTCVYQNRNMNIYIDGELKGSGYFPYETGYNTADNNFALGARPVGSEIEWYFGGTLDDVRVYDRALDAGEIRSFGGVVRYSDVEGCGGSGPGWDPNFGIDGGGNKDVGPCFVNTSDPNGSDDIFGTADDGLYLDVNSLCIDAGDGDVAPSLDIIDSERVDFNDINNTGTGDPNYTDIGAYEFNTGVHNLTKNLYYSTIQKAVDGASNGDTIEVHTGTYYENINFTNMAITLRSIDPNDPCVVEATIIDANNSGRVVTFGNQDANSLISGFTITHGSAIYAGGIYCEGKSPTISNCRIVGNSGRGICSRYSASWPVISGCVIANNGTDGINTEGGSPIVTSSVISGNGDRGIYFWAGSGYSQEPNVSGCTILGNKNYGAYCNGMSATFKNCLIAKNGGYGIRNIAANYTKIINCTIVNNQSYGIIHVGVGEIAVITNCIIWNNGNDLENGSATFSCIQDGDPGVGNFSIDPCFVSIDANNFHLDADSLCIDAGNPLSDYSQEPSPNGGRINLGAYGNTPEAEPTTDTDGDGIFDAWELYFWPGDDPNQHDPNEDEENGGTGDGFTNWTEYLFRYDPNTVTSVDANLAIDETRFSSFPTYTIDPLSSDTFATINYLLNKPADVNVNFVNTETGEVICIIDRSDVPGGVTRTELLNGTDVNGKFVPRHFYDIRIDVDNTPCWTSQRGIPISGSRSDVALDDNFVNPYGNIPIKAEFNITNWCREKIDVVEDGHSETELAWNENYRIYHLYNGLLSPGWNTFYWYGHWGTDINQTGAVYGKTADVYYSLISDINMGVVVVHYDYNEPLANLRCNPIRILPAYNEVSKIEYYLACDANVSVYVYDPDGFYFATLLEDEPQTAGLNKVVFYGKEDGISDYPSTNYNPSTRYIEYDGSVPVYYTEADPNSRYTLTEGTYRIEVSCDKSIEILTGSITVHR